MSELIQKNDNRATIRWKLLTGASVMALTAYAASVGVAKAEDADHPQIWIELGGQSSRLQDGQDVYAPPFVSLTPPTLSSPLKAERPPLYGIDETGKISFQPSDSDWEFSASIRYGRSGSSKNVRHQTKPVPISAYVRFHNTTHNFYYGTTSFVHGSGTAPVDAIAARFTNAVTRESETHAILDFQAGKDLGIGLFGHDASSTLSVGIRVAQFRSKSRVAINEDPDFGFKTNIEHYDHIGSYRSFHITQQLVYQPYHSFAGRFSADRSFAGLGPSISWASSVPFAGNSKDGALDFDWGLNAALLFGRQRTKTQHQTTGRYHTPGINYHPNMVASLITTYQHPAVPHTRSRNVAVPNVGGFAGISFNYSDAKVSLGYRADMFFGVIDGGIDTAKNENRAFYGPYASISIGLGD